MKRVVITGVGIVSPLACEKDAFWQKILRGETGVGDLTKLDPSRFKGITKAAEVDLEKEYKNREVINHFQPYGKAVTYAAAAVDMGLKDAGLEISQKNNYGIILGTTNGNQDIVERIADEWNLDMDHEDLNQAAIQTLRYFRPVELSAGIARYFNLKGTNMVIPTACAAGNYAIGTAYSMIQEGRSSVIIAGGADPFTRSCYTVFYRLGAMAKDHCKPFDQNRTGMIVGEGAAVLVLEELEHALTRGARIYGEITGYGLACDAYDPTAPDPEGSGATLSMTNALTSGNIDAKNITYVSAHGTGTKANDAHEVKAMNNVFGDDISNLYVNGIKSMLGHCMGAASALEAVTAVLSLYHQQIPRNTNTEKIDESFNTHFQIQPPLEYRVEHVLSNSFAFGGNICSVIFSTYDTSTSQQ
ncbi:beta-ketoacyl-[acyl-carrier-protein] synthase family protein [Chryseobacterium lactis]|uniref:3-oxoacyl-[acyl-carrier-protein] synthase 1 n=1 Tax=Chryseobacterium lactis TaxID=1241981 RepID=A0A3G6RHN7_CHRLC|nr:beta-ketoacyl-[acyl-carrier-protein] synthase family protein [Chryseobacterium lactis]AZA83929.1 beta-ketoacyl-[acyl-carrier-protein] synthase family protein [Chryseobacterium lactis]AZB04315.1 beta-ketoacyl-[acyl-carrier-protein] synthase family protein [Chryseobacterium lactis]PNW12773.1 beta-ketoacyl-[acyl-carrier-protein] synthase family protein [Chryseobacterium lactis]